MTKNKFLVFKQNLKKKNVKEKRLVGFKNKIFILTFFYWQNSLSLGKISNPEYTSKACCGGKSSQR